MSQKIKILFLTLIIFLPPVFATGLEENISNSFNNIRNITQESKNKFLLTLTDKFDSAEANLNKALILPEDDCNSLVQDVISDLDNLSSKIEKRKCKKSKSKKGTCLSSDTVNKLLSEIQNTTDSLGILNDDDIAEICTSSDSSTDTSVDNGSETDANTPTTNDLISTCDGKDLKLSDVLKDNLTLSSMSVVDTKLDLGNVEFYLDHFTNGDVYVVKNTSLIPVEVMVSLDDAEFVSADIPAIISLSPKSEQFGFKVCAADSALWNYKYNFKEEQGFSTSIHTGDEEYLLPYKSGQSYVVVQGEMGTFSHFGEYLYSIDFVMPEGTAITAMRDGTIVFIKEDSNEGGADLSFSDKANFIWVLHEDNSIGRYVHLKQNGVLVNLGDKVKAGDVIGLSGNTGRSTGPHLHVQVVLPKGFSGIDLIPIRFKGIDGALIEDKSYTSTP